MNKISRTHCVYWRKGTYKIVSGHCFQSSDGTKIIKKGNNVKKGKRPIKKVDITKALLTFNYDKNKVTNSNKKRLNNIWWWGGNSTLSLLIIAVCRNIRTRGCSYPSDGITYEQWKEILEKIEKGFGLFVDREKTWNKWTKKDEKMYNESWRLFKKYFGDLWD